MNALKFILLPVMLFMASAAHAQAKVIATITNLRNNNGVCRVCLFDNATAFTGEKGAPVQCVDAAVSNRGSEAVFQNISPGAYAIAVFHDANKNNKMDKNFLGIPKEGYGASQNKLPFASAPEFDDNKFITADKTTTTVRIKLRYL